MSVADILRTLLGRRGESRSDAHSRDGARAAPTPSPGRTGRALLDGQSALIVGAGMNVGLGIARELAREGATLCITNMADDDLASVARALHVDGVDALAVRSDVAAAGSEDALVAQLDEHGMTPDILVLNVGVRAATGEPDVAEMERVFRTNVIAPLHLARRVAVRMQSSGRGGTILFVTSIHQWSLFGDALYSASKAAVGMVVRELAAELASARIRVNAIAPGWVASGDRNQIDETIETKVHGPHVQ